MEVQKNIAKFQEKFVVPVPANIAKIVDERDRKILADSYLKLYSGFSWINWTNGHSLGRAWQTALTQCESFINTKKNNNPALKHLPFYLETPNELDGYAKEIEILRNSYRP